MITVRICVCQRLSVLCSTELDVGPLHVPLDLDKCTPKNGAGKKKVASEEAPKVKIRFFGSESTRTRELAQAVQARQTAKESSSTAVDKQRRMVHPSDLTSSASSMTSALGQAMGAASAGRIAPPRELIWLLICMHNQFP
jgi:hypothetical protein